MKFTYGNSVYEVIRTVPSTVDGWTHSAEVKRVRGKKKYYANLVITNGAVIVAKVVA